MRALSLLLLALNSTSWAFPGTGRQPYIPAAPLFVQEAETTWTSVTNPKTTASFNVLAGDVLVAYAGLENGGTGGPMTISGGSLTWTLQQQIFIDTSWAPIFIWTAVVNVDKSMTVTFTAAETSLLFGGNVLTFRKSSGVGNSSQANVDATAPTLNLTTTKANSAVVVFDADWNALDGTSRTWRTNAGSFTEQTYARTAGQYTVYGGFHPNAGAIGTYAVGLTTPAGQRSTIVAVEIKGQ